MDQLASTEPKALLFYDDTDRRGRLRRLVDRVLRRDFQARLMGVYETDPDGDFTITWNAAGVITSNGPVEIREVPQD
jgi:hypothetical protein